MSRESQGKAKARSRRGRSKVKDRSRQGQGKVKATQHQIQLQFDGFDTIEINLVANYHQAQSKPQLKRGWVGYILS